MSKKILRTFLGVFLIRGLIDYVYFDIIADLFAYAGFQSNPTVATYVYSWIILIASLLPFALVYSKAEKRISALIMELLYLMSFVPFTTGIAANMFTLQYIIYGTVYWFCLLLLEVLCLRLSLHQQHVKGLNGWFTEKLFWEIGYIAVFIILYISARYANFRLHFNLLTVYDLRSEAENFGMSRIESLMFSMSKAVIPICFGYSLFKKKRSFAAIFLLSSVVCFGVDGSKTTFFFPILIASLFFANRYIFKNMNICKCVLGVIISLSIISILEWLIFDSYMVASFFVRRLMMLLQQTASYFYDFFLTHTPDFFRSSIFEKIGVVSPYGNISHIIGQVYFGRVVSANCGLIADAVTNFGPVLGCFLMPIIVILFLHICDICSHGLNKVMKGATAIYFSSTLLNSFLSVSLISHGLFVSLILLILLPRDEAISPKKKDCFS